MYKDTFHVIYFGVQHNHIFSLFSKLSDVGLLGSGSGQVRAWRTSNCNGNFFTSF